MKRINNNFTVKRITSNLIELIPEINSIDRKIERGRKRSQCKGILKLRCNQDIDNFRKEGKLINCYGTPGFIDSEKINFEPLLLEKHDNGEIQIVSQQVMVELEEQLFFSVPIGTDTSSIYEPILTKKILNSFGDVSKSNGYVYLIKSDYGYKIGCSKSPKTRNNIFTIKLPFEVEMIRTYNVRDYKNTEKIVQDSFSASHLNGEWYDLKDEEIIEIDNLVKDYLVE